MAKSNRICSIPGCGKPHEARGWCSRHYDLWRLNGDPTLRRKAAHGDPIEFISRVASGGFVSGCVEWPFAKNKGYGIIKTRNKTRTAHNVVCEIAHGIALDDSYEAAHSCGNRICVNPAHLRWATSRENNADKIAHGTQTSGETHGTSRLTEAAVRFIRRNYPLLTQYELAERFSVSQSAVSGVVTGRTWVRVK